ncbi:MAG: trimethylamine methyltransferase family protein, partial [Lentisphaeria bacterium]|nr:trimethylamine methyltransferase family protein [Lentisphaeria bacterium]
VLGRTGFKVYSKRILDKVAALGAKVDYDTMTARFPRELIEEIVDCELRPEQPDKPISVSKEFHASFGEVCFFLYDWEKQERRTATREETIQFIRLGDALSGVGAISPPAVNSDIDPLIEAIEAPELLIANTNKPAGGGIRSPEQVKYIHEIRMLSEKHGDPRRWVQTGGCLTSPLALGERSAQIVEVLMDLGYDDFAFSSMPIAGGNAPVTTAGCIVICIAELLGARLVARAINPKANGVGMLISGTMDMTHGNPSFCSPQAVTQDIVTWRVFNRLYGLDIPLDRGGSYINAKLPGLQCAYERTFKQSMLAVGTGALGMHAGSLDGAAIFSPEQAMIDLDLSRGQWDFYRGIEISDETLALDEIDQVGIGESGSYLNTDHTFRHFRKALWMPKLLDVSMWHDGEETGREQRMLEEANKQWKECLANRQAPKINEALLGEVHEVVERAKREIGN